MECRRESVYKGHFDSRGCSCGGGSYHRFGVIHRFAEVGVGVGVHGVARVAV